MHGTCAVSPAGASAIVGGYSGVPAAGALVGTHNVVYIAAADNIGGRDLKSAVEKA